MRIALTFNLKRSAGEHEAEFDTEETIAMLAGLLASLGCTVVPIDVSCSIDALLRRLRKSAPDLVFNIAEGRCGSFREAFYPALFEQLGLPYTGSSASVLALCLDKALSKRVVAAAGVAVPRGVFVRNPSESIDLELPVIVKPNFEGSSIGISQSSVVVDRGALGDVLRGALARFSDGVVVEELVDGMDVSVAWVAGLGVLAPIGYAYEPTGPHRILDLALKQGPPDRVRMEIPARLRRSTLAAIQRSAARAFEALGVTGYGRADFRVTPSGQVRFLEMNPLPSLAPSDEELYVSAARVGKTPRDLVAAIVDAALARSSPAAIHAPYGERAAIAQSVGVQVARRHSLPASRSNVVS